MRVSVVVAVRIQVAVAEAVAEGVSGTKNVPVFVAVPIVEIDGTVAVTICEIVLADFVSEGDRDIDPECENEG